MSEKKKEPQKEAIEWLSDFTKESIRKSAEIEIKPKLTIELGIENAKNVHILSIPYLVEIPKEKAIGSNRIWMIDLQYNNIAHQFTCQAGSFRFQLGVLKEKLGLKTIKELINLYVKIWKTLEFIDTPSFKGKAEMYHIALIE